ncbi:MAG: glycoside hydrolase family 3 protein [Phycisphaerae bacterium]
MNDTTRKLLDSMTLEQKVGQMLCLGFCGSYPHPDIIQMIEKYHVAGFRVTPYATKFVRYLSKDHPGVRRVTRDRQPYERVYGAKGGHLKPNAYEYAKVLNELRQRSIDTGAGVPLYFALDFEGGVSADLLESGMHSVPHPMGQAASGDPELAYKAGYLTGKQMKAAGIDWVHSPDVDVNTDPANPEISTRSYSPKVETVIEYVLQILRGYKDANFVATGKHFPGRGHSAVDAHFDVPSIEESAERMQNIHLAPYKAMIESGMLPAVMLAHSVYPALDPSGEISTLSRPIVTGVLREQLGFEGVILTDSFTMGGLVARYEVPEAAVRSIEAGVDIVLLKDENALRGEIYEAIFDAVRSGRISEDRVHESVARVLTVKEQYGLLDGNKGMVDMDELRETLEADEIDEIGEDIHRRTVALLRNDGSTLPLQKNAKVLVVEENCSVYQRHRSYNHSIGMLYHALLERGVDCQYTDFEKWNFDECWPTIQEMAQWADVVVYTGYYNRGNNPHRGNYEKIESLDKSTVFVGNNPYGLLVTEGMKNVFMISTQSRYSMEMVADVLTGTEKPTAKLDFDPARTY